MPRSKYDWAGMVSRAQARPDEWVLGFKNVPVALRSRIRWRQGVDLEHLPPNGLSSVAVNLYRPDGQTKHYGDIWVRWNGDVAIEPPLRLPEDLAEIAPPPGRQRNVEQKRSRGWAIAKASTAHKGLVDLVRKRAIGAHVPMTAIVNAVVTDIADPASGYEPPKPPAPDTRERASLNSTVPDETWAAAMARADQIGQPLWRLIKKELARRVGYHDAD